MNAVIITLNPWHRPDSAYSPKTFTYHDPAVFEHRGVEVRRGRLYDSWDYILAGVTIMQRRAFNPALATEVIDAKLDGHEACADSVCDHLRRHGHRGLSYSEASALD